MKSCAHCGTTVLLGGLEDHGRRFCSAECRTRGAATRETRAIPQDVLDAAVHAVLEAGCPVCGGAGPVGAFTSHTVTSDLVVTSWRSEPRISCRGCATRAQLGGILHSLVLGWWGFPWGLVMTPVQVFRNLAGLARRADRERPSVLLTTLVQGRLAAERVVARGAPPAVARPAA